MAGNSSVDSLPQVLDDPTMREDRAKLTELHRQLADMGTHDDARKLSGTED